MTDLHLLDLSNTLDKTVTPINSNQTLGSDWLLTTPVEDEVCATFPSPYDNDYRGGDPNNPDETPSRFNPDKPVFAKLPDDTYALFDSRLIVNENTLENPLMDGGGSSVLRSSLRADKLGVAKNPYTESYTVFNEDNIVLCSNEQPNFLNEDNCVLSYEENVCVKEYVTSTGRIRILSSLSRSTTPHWPSFTIPLLRVTPQKLQGTFTRWTICYGMTLSSAATLPSCHVHPEILYRVGFHIPT